LRVNEKTVPGGTVFVSPGQSAGEGVAGPGIADKGGRAGEVGAAAACVTAVEETGPAVAAGGAEGEGADDADGAEGDGREGEAPRAIAGGIAVVPFVDLGGFPAGIGAHDQGKSSPSLVALCSFYILHSMLTRRLRCRTVGLRARGRAGSQAATSCDVNIGVAAGRRGEGIVFRGLNIYD